MRNWNLRQRFGFEWGRASRRPSSPRKAPVRFRFVFSSPFIINKIGRFVFSFVFSTATCFQQLLRFVFGFVSVCFFSRSFIFSNFSGLFFKITSFLSHLSQKARKLAFSPCRKRCVPVLALVPHCSHTDPVLECPPGNILRAGGEGPWSSK